MGVVMRRIIVRVVLIVGLLLSTTGQHAVAAGGYLGCTGGKRLQTIVFTQVTELHQHWVEGHGLNQHWYSGWHAQRTAIIYGDWQAGIYKYGISYWTGSYGSWYASGSASCW
jgi:hypothetical protein